MDLCNPVESFAVAFCVENRSRRAFSLSNHSLFGIRLVKLCQSNASTCPASWLRLCRPGTHRFSILELCRDMLSRKHTALLLRRHLSRDEQDGVLKDALFPIVFIEVRHFITSCSSFWSLCLPRSSLNYHDASARFSLYPISAPLHVLVQSKPGYPWSSHPSN